MRGDRTAGLPHAHTYIKHGRALFWDEGLQLKSSQVYLGVISKEQRQHGIAFSVVEAKEGLEDGRAAGDSGWMQSLHHERKWKRLMGLGVAHSAPCLLQKFAEGSNTGKIRRQHNGICKKADHLRERRLHTAGKRRPHK